MSTYTVSACAHGAPCRGGPRADLDVGVAPARGGEQQRASTIGSGETPTSSGRRGARRHEGEDDRTAGRSRACRACGASAYDRARRGQQPAAPTCRAAGGPPGDATSRRTSAAARARCRRVARRARRTACCSGRDGGTSARATSHTPAPSIAARSAAQDHPTRRLGRPPTAERRRADRTGEHDHRPDRHPDEGDDAGQHELADSRAERLHVVAVGERRAGRRRRRR